MISARWLVVTTALCLMSAAGALAAESSERDEIPICVQRRDTWWETMIASRETLVEREASAERQAEAAREADPALRTSHPFRTWVSNQDEPSRIRLRIAGLKRLYVGSSGHIEVFLGDPQWTGGDGQPTALPLAGARVSGGHGWANKDVDEWAQKKYSTGVLLWNKENGSRRKE